MTRRLTQLAGGLVGIVVVVALLAGVPWLLISQVGSPLPASWPDLDTLRHVATIGVTDTFVITTLAVIVWIAWTQVTVAIVVELVAAIRRRPARPLPVLAGAQPLAARIVATTLLIVTALQPRPMLAATPLDMPVATAPALFDQPVATTEPPAATRTSALSDTTTVTVGARDSWWTLAERHLGDGLRWRELRELNCDRHVGNGTHIRPDTEQLLPGWSLLVPATGDAADRHPDPDPGGDDTDDAGPPVWDVQPGDHFWGIAEHTLEQAWGRAPTDAEIVPYWEQLIEANRARLLPPADPNLIYPGQQFVLPDPPAVAGADNSSRAEETIPHDGPNDVGSDAPSDVTTDNPQAEVDGPSDGKLTAPDETEPSARDGQSAVADPEDSSVEAYEPEPADDVASDDERTRWGTPVSLASSTAATGFIAAGVLILLRRRRRLALQRRLPQVRLPPLSPDAVAQTARLHAAEPSDEVLDELAVLLCSIPADVDPEVVIADDDGSVTLMFDRDDPPLPMPPWTLDDGTADEPLRWSARLGDRGPRRSIGLPLLVTLGRTGTATWLANIAAMTILTVTAHDDDDSVVRRRLRAFALEAATSRTAGPIVVAVVGDPGIDGIEQLQSIDNPEAQVAAALEEADQQIIAEDRLPRLIICHDPVNVPHVPPGLDLVGVIAPGDTETQAPWRLDLDDASCVLHLADGNHVILKSPGFDPDLVTAELGALGALDAADPASSCEPDPRAPADSDSGRSDLTDATPQDADVSAKVAEASGWCEVGLLGPVTVTCGDEQVDTVAGVVLEVLAYLATHRSSTVDQLQDAVWAGHAGTDHRVRSALKRLRSELGTTPDGDLLVPRRGPRERTIQLAPTVTTDIDRALRHLDAARQLDGDQRLARLQDALDLVRGAPFEDLAVSWAIDIEHQATAQLQDAALEAAVALLDAGRLDDAEHAVRQGLKLCDPCEPLYVAWAQIEHARDRPHRISQLWTRLKQRLAEDVDETFEVPARPTAVTEAAFAALTGRGRAAQ